MEIYSNQLMQKRSLREKYTKSPMNQAQKWQSDFSRLDSQASFMYDDL